MYLTEHYKDGRYFGVDPLSIGQASWKYLINEMALDRIMTKVGQIIGYRGGS